MSTQLKKNIVRVRIISCVLVELSVVRLSVQGSCISVEVINSSDRLGADEASFKVWSAYQRWRVTKIRLGGILLNQETVTKDSQIFTFPLASSIYSTVLGESMRSRSLTHDS